MAKKTREKKSPMGGGASRRGGAEAAKPKHSMSTDNGNQRQRSWKLAKKRRDRETIENVQTTTDTR